MSSKQMFITLQRNWVLHDIRSGDKVVVQPGRYAVERVRCPRHGIWKLVLKNFYPDGCIGADEKYLRDAHSGKIVPRTWRPDTDIKNTIEFENDDSPELNFGDDEINPRANFGFGSDGNMVIHEIFKATVAGNHIDRTVKLESVFENHPMVRYLRIFGFVIDCNREDGTFRVRHPRLIG